MYSIDLVFTRDDVALATLFADRPKPFDITLPPLGARGVVQRLITPRYKNTKG